MTNRAQQLGKIYSQKGFLLQKSIPSVATLLPQPHFPSKKSTGTRKVLKTTVPGEQGPASLHPLEKILRFPTCFYVMIWGSQKYKSYIILAVSGFGHDASHSWTILLFSIKTRSIYPKFQLPSHIPR